MSAAEVYAYTKHQVARPPLRIELRLIRLAQAGSAEAKRILVLSHQKFIASIAAKYAHQGSSPEDLLGAGNLGMAEAIDRCDANRGLRLNSFAVWWIRKAILDHVYENRHVVHVPRNVLDKTAAAERKALPLLASLRCSGSLSTTVLLSDDMHAAINFARPVQGVSSIDVFAHEDEDRPAYVPDVLCTYQEYDDEHEWLRKLAQRVLTPREFDIVRLHFGLERDEKMTYTEIAARYKVSRERIRQIIQKSLADLRLVLQEEQDQRPVG